MFSFNHSDHVCIILQESEGSDSLLSMMEVGPVAESTPAPTRKLSKDTLVFQTPEGCLYSPSVQTTLDVTSMPAPRGRSRSAGHENKTPLEKMNQFLESKDISPVRYHITVPWTESSARTR